MTTNPTTTPVLSANDEQAPLLQQATPSNNFDLTHVPAWDPQALRMAHKQAGPVTGLLWVAEVGIIIWFIVLWRVVLTHPAGLFTFHPLLQSFAILAFYQGILVLQPTKTPSQKRSGLTVHEFFQIGGTIAIATGTVVMIINKSLHNAPHFTSWHGLLGVITASVLVIQALFGGLIGFEWSRRLILGESRARSLWRYHRASGYLIILLITLTFLTATKSDWLVMVSSEFELRILTITSIVSVFGLLGLTNIKKIIPA